MKKILLIVGLLVVLVYPFKVDAKMCTMDAYTIAEKDAYGVIITHELVIEEYWDYAYYNLTISNMTKNIQVVYEGDIYTYGMDEAHPDSIVVDVPASIDTTAVFEVFPIDGSDCMGHRVHKIEHKVPYYNVYIGTDECAAYPNFPLCAKNYRGDATVEEFLTELENYKKTGVKPDKPAEKDDRNVFEKIADIYMDYKMITIPLTIIGASCIVVLAKRHMSAKKKRAKFKVKI
jgi:hypothetical protein